MKPTPRVYRETRFRLPSAAERDLSLWVDRVGAGPGGRFLPERLRVFGQFAAVAIEAGTAVFTSPATGKVEVPAGHAILLFPDEPTTYGGAPACQTCWVVWNGPEAAKLARHAGLSPRNPVVRGAAAAVRRAYETLGPLLPAESFDALLERKRLVLGLLAELVRLRQDAAVAGIPAARLHALLQRLADPDTEAAPVPEMARTCHLSEAQFRRLFRRHTGRTPVEFLTARRMARAKELLAHGLSIKDVARRTGYADVFYFMRVFRKATGQTAGGFVRQNAGHAG
jgi:AraC-like DNA-binding protein